MELGLGFNSAALFVSLPHSALCLTGLFTSVIHILNLRETCVPVFAGGYIILRILKFFKVYKRQNKTPPFFTFLMMKTTVTSQLTESTNAAQNIYLICSA